MKNQSTRRNTLSLPVLAALIGLVAGLTSGVQGQQGTAFTYQGFLTSNGVSAKGSNDFIFSLYPYPTAPEAITAMEIDGVVVSNGLFTVTLDFGSAILGGNRALEIGVRPSGTKGSFTTLSPRQPLTPTPYAISAQQVSASGITGILGEGSLSANVARRSGGNSFTGTQTISGGRLGIGAASPATAVHVAGPEARLRLESTSSTGFSVAEYVTDARTWHTGVGGSQGVNQLNSKYYLFDNTAGQTRLVVDTAGNVGIGTVVPQARLQVASDSPAPQLALVQQNPVDFARLVMGVDGFPQWTLSVQPSATPVLNFWNGAANVAWIDFDGGVHGKGFSGDGANVTGVNAALLNGQSSAGFWKTGGNAGANPTNGAFLGTTDNLPFEIRVNGQRALRLQPGLDAPNIVNGSSFNIVSNGVSGGTIGGGGVRVHPNRLGGNFATVVGGFGNVATGYASTAMGDSTTASGDFSTAMGEISIASGYYSIGMGYQAHAYGYASIAMGDTTTASGDWSTAMGYRTYASGHVSAAAGRRAVAATDGSFVWADMSVDSEFTSTSSNQFLIRATGGVGIGTTAPQAALHVIGNIVASGSISPSSDRNLKEHFAPVSPREVLEKVSALPITQWNYKSDSDSVRHIGPMAQDFRSAFNLGMDDKHISTVDADGVALAAIQGLNQRLTEELKRRDAENAELRRELSEIKQLLLGRSGGAK